MDASRLTLESTDALDKLDTDLKAVAKDKVALVGKGDLKHWILTEHKDAGEEFVVELKRKADAAEQARKAAARDQAKVVKEQVAQEKVDTRRTKILNYFLEVEPTIPKQKQDVIDHLKKENPGYANTTLATDIVALTEARKLVCVGKQGANKMWISTEHKKDGDDFLAALQVKPVRAINPALARRQKIVDFVGADPASPKKKSAILNHLQEDPDFAATPKSTLTGWLNADLHALNPKEGGGQLVSVGAQAGENKLWILTEHKEAGETFVAESRAAADEAKAANREPSEKELLTKARRTSIRERIEREPEVPTKRSELVIFLSTSPGLENTSHGVLTRDLVALQPDIIEIKLEARPEGSRSLILAKHAQLGMHYLQEEEKKRLQAEKEKREKPGGYLHRRTQIVKFLTDNKPEQGKTRQELLDFLNAGIDDVGKQITIEKVANALKKLTEEKVIAMLELPSSKKTRRWILPQHEDVGRVHLQHVEEDRLKTKAEEAAKQGETKEYEERRMCIVAFFHENPGRKKAALMVDLQKQFPNVKDDQVNKDLAHLTKSEGSYAATLVLVSEIRIGPNRAWSLLDEQEQEQGKDYLAAEEEDERERKKEERESKSTTFAVYGKRRKVLIDMLTKNGPNHTSRKTIGTELGEGTSDEAAPNSRQINHDLKILVAAQQIAMFGLERSPLRSYSLKEHADVVQIQLDQDLAEKRQKRANVAFKFTDEQLSKLKGCFETNTNPTLRERENIKNDFPGGAEACGLMSITNWFRNEREKAKTE
jgi:hypothetical protein